jgi:hypothetical protein
MVDMMDDVDREECSALVEADDDATTKITAI